MDAILKSMVFGLIFIVTLILTAPSFNSEEEKAVKKDDASIENSTEQNTLHILNPDVADYPSEFLVG